MAELKLNPKQESFVDEYLIDFNGTQAAIRSGYSENTAQQIASENLSKPLIQDAVRQAMLERQERVKVDADYVLKRLIEIDQMDVLDIMNDDYSFKPIGEWPKIWRQYVSNIENIEGFDGFGEDRVQSGWLKKIKWPDKVKNLELLGKHVVVGAFKDKIEHTGKINITEISDDELNAKLAALVSNATG